MEIKINKEIRSYKETVYFGLTARQLICSLLAVGTAVGLYFALRGVLDRETLGWLCIVGAAPMAAAGFFHYNGLTLEQFLWAWCKTNFLLAGRRCAGRSLSAATPHTSAFPILTIACANRQCPMGRRGRRPLQRPTGSLVLTFHFPFPAFSLFSYNAYLQSRIFVL